MKIEEQVLSIEQMKHLQELGIDTSDASMFWVRAKRITGEQKNNCIDNDMGKWRLSLSKGIVLPAAWAVESVPTYTIGDLIEKLPVRLNGLHIKPSDRRIFIDWEYTVKSYMNYGEYCPVFFPNRSFIELLYIQLCWVAENHKEVLNENNQQ